MMCEISLAVFSIVSILPSLPTLILISGRFSSSAPSAMRPLYSNFASLAASSRRFVTGSVLSLSLSINILVAIL